MQNFDFIQITNNFGWKHGQVNNLYSLSQKIKSSQLFFWCIENKNIILFDD
jgi:hypothetical protein